MATITSSTHGYFDAGSTWVGGTAPVNFDSFIVNYGHIVTVTGDQRKAGGFDDSFVRGKLQLVSGAQLRMSGILYVDNTAGATAYFASGNTGTAGFFRMDNGSILEIRGSNTDQHRLEIRGQGYITCEIEGNNPNPSTTLSGNYDVNSSKFTVQNLNGIAIGDWVSVFNSSRTSQNYANNTSDEGIWVHDISGSDIYFRKFVSPTATITSTFTSGVYVDDASVFRTGYATIFGTGANLNIQSINVINYFDNSISFNSSITGSVIGEKIYETSFEKAHFSGDTVQKIASTLTADSNVGASTITVNSTSGFSIGDLILIPCNNEATTSTWDIVQDYKINNIVGNTITITGGYTNSAQNTLAAPVKSGGIVANMKRDTQIIPPSGATSQQSFVYVPSYTTNYTRRIKIKNTLFNIGSNTNSSVYGSVGLRGYWSYDETSGGNYTSLFEGNVIYPSVRTTYSNITTSDNRHQLNMRNNISYNANDYGIYAAGNNVGLFNNICCRMGAYGVFADLCADVHTQFCYNYIIRSDDLAYSFRSLPDTVIRLNHNYALYTNLRPFEIYYCQAGLKLNNWYIDGFRYWPLIRATSGSPIVLNNSYVGNAWDITRPSGTPLVYTNGVNFNYDSGDLRRCGSFTNVLQITNANFKFGKSFTTGGFALRYYDNLEQAWRVYPDLDYTGYAGFINVIYVPAGSKVFITAQVKTMSQFGLTNTNYPYLYIRTNFDYWAGQYSTIAKTVQNSSSSVISEQSGFVDSQRFTSASATNYETIVRTVPAQKFDYFLSFGVTCINPSASNGRTGWYEKNIKASIEVPSQVPDILLLNNLTTQIPVNRQQTAIQLKTILGG